MLHIDASSQIANFDESICLGETFEDGKVDWCKGEIGMSSSGFAEEEDVGGKLLDKKIDELWIVFEEVEEQIEIILNSNIFTSNSEGLR